jgi:hypothetical protein
LTADCSFLVELSTVSPIVMTAVIPRYLAVLAYGTFVPLIKIGCCLNLLFVKSIYTVLYWLSFIRHFLVQIATLLTADYSFLVELSTVSPIVMTAVSSADVAMVLFDVVGTTKYMTIIIIKITSVITTLITVKLVYSTDSLNFVGCSQNVSKEEFYLLNKYVSSSLQQISDHDVAKLHSCR